MKKLSLFVALGVVALFSTKALATVPDMVPIQGVLTDSADQPIDALTDLTFTLYDDQAGTTNLWTDTFVDVDVVEGFFTIYLGSNTPLDFTSLISNSEIWLGITVDTDPEMDRIQLTSVPFAVEADVCSSVGTLTEADINSNFLPSTYAPDWTDIVNVPADISDDTDPTNELLTSVVLNGTSLEIMDPGGTHVANLAVLVDDADANPANELNTSIVLNGTALEVTDAAGTLTADLASLVDDADADATNELNSSVVLNGTSLEVTDNGGTITTDLGSLVDTASDILTKLMTVDGSGSGLDADLLDGLEAADIIAAAGPENRTEISSIPYTITTPGSYVVVNNLTNTGTNSDGITIDSDNVTLDLGGFVIDGAAMGDDGIVVLGDQRGIHIFNGVVTNWGGDGINALNADNSLFDNLVVSLNNGDGLVTDFACVISNVVARLNGIDGIEGDDGTVITDCSAMENGDNGIQTSEGCVVSNCGSFDNGTAGTQGVITRNSDCDYTQATGHGGSGDGIDVGSGSVVVDCSATDNQNFGFDVAIGGSIQGCVAYDNFWNGFDLASACIARNNIASLNMGHGFRTFANSWVIDNKAHENDYDGIRISSTDSVVEGNNVTDNDQVGIQVTSSGSLILSNKSAGNLYTYCLDASSSYGPIVSIVGVGDISTVTNADHPYANFVF